MARNFRVSGGEGNRSGYLTHGDILTHTIDGVDLNQLWSEFINTNTIYNEHKQGMVGLMTYNVTADIELVPQIGDFNFEEASEFGFRHGRSEQQYRQPDRRIQNHPDQHLAAAGNRS